MKYLKMIGLAAVAAMALTAFAGAGTASAGGVLCSTATEPCTSKWATGTELDFSLKPGTSALLTTTEGTPLNTCTESTVKGDLEKNPNTSGNAAGPLTTITFDNCNFTVDTITKGRLEVIEGDGKGNGKVKAYESEITVNTGLFGSCVFEAGAAGTVLGPTDEGFGTAATLTVNAVVNRKTGLCPQTAKWVATYILTSPEKTLYVSKS
jgi:hypothetical protein